MEKFYDALKQVKNMELDISNEKDISKFCSTLQDLVPDYKAECMWLKRIMEKEIHLEFVGKKDIELSEKKQIIDKVKKKLEIEEGFAETTIEKMLMSLTILGEWSEKYEEINSQLEKNIEEYKEENVKKSKNKSKGIIIAIVAVIFIAIGIAKMGGSIKLDERTLQERDAIKNAAVGDVVTFGENNIEWKVLEKTDDEVFLITEEIVAEKDYNEGGTVNFFNFKTWEECTLRKWLNEDFYNEAFSEGEQKLIKTTLVNNEIDSEYGIDGGNNTEDKIFILNIDQLYKYFQNQDPLIEGSGWWLRSPGCFLDKERTIIHYTDSDDEENDSEEDDALGDIPMSFTMGVRPALWLDMQP